MSFVYFGQRIEQPSINILTILIKMNSERMYHSLQRRQVVHFGQVVLHKRDIHWIE